VNDFWGYVIAGYAVTGFVLAGYAIWIIRRGRQLSKLVPGKERRWTST
jgi:heme exporter protein CcmD